MNANTHGRLFPVVGAGLVKGILSSGAPSIMLLYAALNHTLNCVSIVPNNEDLNLLTNMYTILNL